MGSDNSNSASVTVQNTNPNIQYAGDWATYIIESTPVYSATQSGCSVSLNFSGEYTDVFVLV